MPARSTLTRALSLAVLPTLFAAAAVAQRTTSPIDRPRRDPAARLPKPDALTITQLSSTSVRFSWAPVEGAKGYILGRTIGTNGLQRVNVPMSLQTEYVDTDVRVGVRVAYAVTAVDSNDLAGLRAITPDFIPVAMAPATLPTPADSTASDSTRRDSTTTSSGIGGSSGAPGGSTAAPAVHTASGCPAGSLSTGSLLDSRARSVPTRDRPPTVDAKLDHARIAVQWRSTDRDVGTWEVWDQIDGVEHFAARLPASASRFDLAVARAGIHIPMVFYITTGGYAGPVCPRGVRVSDEMLADLSRTSGAGSGAAPGSTATPSLASNNDVNVETLAPLTIKVRESVPIADRILAREWLSLDPDVATVAYGAVRGLKGGVARIVGLTTNLDGTIRMNLVRVTVVAPPPQRGR